MQSATGQYSTHAGDPAHPVQHSLITARMCGLRLRCVVVPVDIGAYLTTVPALNSSMLGAPYDTRILHESFARIYSCRQRTSCQSGCANNETHSCVHKSPEVECGRTLRRNAPGFGDWATFSPQAPLGRQKVNQIKNIPGPPRALRVRCAPCELRLGRTFAPTRSAQTNPKHTQ